MRLVRDDDPVDRMVRDAAPEPQVAVSDEVVDDLLARLAVDTMSVHPVRRGAEGPTRGRRWRRAGAVPLAAVTVALTAAAAVAVWYDTASPDFGDALDRYSTAISLPPGTDRQAYVSSVQAQGLERPGSISDAGTQSMVAYYGICAWLTAWERREAAGDATGAGAAVDALRRAVTAPALAATDGGGVVANLQRVADAAQRGDRDAVTVELVNNCATLPLNGIR